MRETMETMEVIIKYIPGGYTYSWVLYNSAGVSVRAGTADTEKRAIRLATYEADEYRRAKDYGTKKVWV